MELAWEGAWRPKVLGSGRLIVEGTNVTNKDAAPLRVLILTPSLEDGIGMSVTYRSLMLKPLCDVRVGVLHVVGERNRAKLEQAGVEVVDLGGRHEIDLGSLIRTLRWAREVGPHIVQVEQASTYLHGWLLSRLLRAKLLVVLNSPSSPFVGPYWRIRWASRFLFPRADHIVCNSAFTCSRLTTHYPALEARSAVIHPPIDADRFVPSDIRPRSSVGVVATMVPFKRLDFLLRAWPAVVSQVPDATLDLYGDGPSRPGWEALARSLDLGPEVQFRGFVADPAAAMSRLGIFVQPSGNPLAAAKSGVDMSRLGTSVQPIQDEAYGQVFVEAMLLERPCVAIRGGGVPEVIADGETGILVPPGDDPQPLAEAIVGLLQDPLRADAMGRAGRERALSRFTVDVIRPQYMRIYHKLLGASG